MNNPYLLAIILAYGPMRGKKYQIVGVLRSEGTSDLYHGIENEDPVLEGLV